MENVIKLKSKAFSAILLDLNCSDFYKIVFMYFLSGIFQNYFVAPLIIVWIQLKIANEQRECFIREMNTQRIKWKMSKKMKAIFNIMKNPEVESGLFTRCNSRSEKQRYMTRQMRMPKKKKRKRGRAERKEGMVDNSEKP